MDAQSLIVLQEIEHITSVMIYDSINIRCTSVLSLISCRNRFRVSRKGPLDPNGGNLNVEIPKQKAMYQFLRVHLDAWLV